MISVFNFGEGLLAFIVMLEDLQDQKTLLGVHDVGNVVLVHLEDSVFEFLGEFAALVDAEEAALLGGAAVGKALGHFAEVFAVFNALKSGVGFFLEVGDLFGDFLFGVDFD